ncbi:MAG: hypothetical protein QNL62_16280 [Gammaproteobacteria bacterium]|nr:hypothetical protein [Gammaproteobacteria bacterium]
MLKPTLSHKNTNYPQLTALLWVLVICILLCSNSFFASKAYAEKSYIKCWKNAQELTECGNRVPREYYNQRIRYIDDKGVTRKVKQRAKTKEELEYEKEIEKLLSLEAEQKRKSAGYDEVLLKTYLTIDDLLSSLNSKLDIIKARSNILKTSLELKKRKFGNLVRQAADMERSGKQISNKLADNLNTSRAELRNLQSQITKEEQDTQRIRETFAHDVERFMLVKASGIKHSLTTPSKAKKLHAVRLSCLNQTQCDLHWENANNFIQEFATTPVIYKTSKISVSDTPVKPQDIAMGLSLLDTDKDEIKIIIMQIRCHRERLGQEFCAGGEVNGLLKEFKSVVYQ